MFLQNYSVQRLSKTLIISSIVLLSLNACSFKSASGVAAQQLLDRGAFQGQTPGWVSQSSVNQSRYSDPSLGFNNQHGFRSGLSNSVLERQYKARNENLKKARESAKAKPKESSPLDRILELCPRIEEQLNKALVTTELSARIAQYESLTKRCAISSELWVWLGSDYLASSDYHKAKSCAEKAISLDPRNKEASELINKASQGKAAKN